MTELEFISKWRNHLTTGYWETAARLVFWARSETMTFEELASMSKDFLSIPGIEDNYCSSLELAQKYVVLN